VTSAALLAIEDLKVTFSTRNGIVEALRGVSLHVERGETVGIVGESGSGKSVTAYAVMGLLDRAAHVAGGRVGFRGQDLLAATRPEMRALRGGALSMIFQNPRAALNPIRPVGEQIADVLIAHGALSRRAAADRALELLDAVRIRDAPARLHAYPHELSGGMCQRVMIAMAMASAPQLIIADEPTTGLDVTTQKVVMDLLAELCATRRMGLVFITHDLALASQYCQRVVVMEKGLVVETAAPATLFSTPEHDYTRRLVAASPTATSTVGSLVGAEPPIGQSSAREPSEPRRASALLDVSGLTKRFNGSIIAVDNVSFTIGIGESVGLVGESGSGKSTIARLVARLIDQTAGALSLDGAEIGKVPARTFHGAPQRRDIQIVFQDAGESINPRFTAFDAIADPLRVLGGVAGNRALENAVVDCAKRCGLPLELLDRFPHQLSGGQRARVGIARAIITGPRLLVLDEPTAALDVSVQALILHLLDKLRRETGMAFLFVSHDLNVVRMMCERTIVLNRGQIVEEGPSRRVFQAPQAAYTRELMAAIPLFSNEIANATA